MRDGPAEEGVANSGVSASELLCPTIRHRPDLLLRQHSMPASLQTCSATSSDVYSHRVYKGLVAGADQGNCLCTFSEAQSLSCSDRKAIKISTTRFQPSQFLSCLWVLEFHLEGNSRQRLQKSLSLDETKTKMASSIIKNVLSKKMQVKQTNSKTSYLQKPEMLPSLPQPAHQQRRKEGGGKKTGGGVLKVPVHAVRDMRSLVKNTYSLSFTNAPTTPENIQPRCIKVTGQEESPPPTYQQAVGVKKNDETHKSCKASVCSSFSTGNTTKVAACLRQSQDKKPSNRFTQQRQDSEPILNRNKVDDVTWSLMLNLPTNSSIHSDLSEHSQSEKATGVTHQAGTYQSPSVSIQPFPHAPSASRQTKGTQPLLSAKDQSSSLDVSSQFAPSSSQQILHSCFYPTTTLHASTQTLHPKVGNVSYMHRPPHYIQTQLQPFSPAHTLRLLRRSEANYSGSTIYTSNQLDWTCPPHRTRTAGDQESNGDTVTPAIQGQHELQKLQQQLQQQQFLCSIQGFLPAQVGNDFPVDVAGSAAAPGALLTGPTSCHIMPNPKTGQCIHVNTPPQPQTKMLLDPETGQYVQVFLPAAGSAPKTNVFPVYFVNRAPFVSSHAPSAMNPTTSLLSVMQFQPMAPVSSLYAHPCLPSNPTHTIS